MIEIEKKNLEKALLTISAFDSETKKMVSGLLMEHVTLGTKRKLQKIHKELAKEHTSLLEDFRTVTQECGEDKEKLEKEVKILLEEVIKINLPKINLSEIELISSEHNYDFDIIEKFAE